MRQLTTAKKMDNGHALTDAEYEVVRPVFNRHLYVSQQAHDWGSRSALNLKLDWAEVQRQYLENNVTYVDNFLEPEALDEIERYCLETTAWFDTRTGYVGAYREGFQPPALLRAAEQVRASTRCPILWHLSIGGCMRP